MRSGISSSTSTSLVPDGPVPRVLLLRIEPTVSFLLLPRAPLLRLPPWLLPSSAMWPLSLSELESELETSLDVAVVPYQAGFRLLDRELAEGSGG